MPRSVLIAAALALVGAPAAAQGLRPREQALVDQVGVALQRGCEPNTLGRLPLTPDDPALAAAGFTAIVQPPEYQRDSLTVGPGLPTYATMGGEGGNVLLASAPAPARICQVLVTDAPTRFWAYLRFEPGLLARGWRLADYRDGTDVDRRLYRHRGSRGDDATLRLIEYKYGDGPAGRVRLLATVQYFPRSR